MKERSMALFLILLLVLAPARGQGIDLFRDGFRICSGGTVEISGPGVRAVAVQPWDGKIVIGGDFSASAGAVTRQYLARLNPDGTLDAAFNPAPDGPVHALVLQPALRQVIAGGSFRQIGGTARNGVARLREADGSADPFNPATTSQAVTVNALALAPDGVNLFLGGTFGQLIEGVPCPPNLAGVSVPAVGGGAPNWSYSGAALDGPVLALLLQGGGVLAGGGFTLPGGYLARFASDGTPDAGFTPPAPGGAVRALALQADGKIVLGGDFVGGALGRSYLARLTPQGSRDEGFAPQPDGYVAALAVQPNGRILVAGGFASLASGALPRNRLARLKISGAGDPGFDPAPDGAVLALALQPDGKVLAGGEFAAAGGKPRTRLARFYPQLGTVDDDLPELSFFSGTPEVMSLTQHADGDTTVIGTFTKVLGLDRGRIARFREDWSLVGRPEYNPRLTVGPTPTILIPQKDKSVFIGGSFSFVNYSAGNQAHRLSARFDPRGRETPYGANFAASAQIGVEGGLLRSTKALVPIPPERHPDGTVTEGGLYVGGLFLPDTSPVRQFRFLTKLDDSGVRDPAFLPPEPASTGIVGSLALEPAGTLLVGTYNGYLLRLDQNGGLIEDLTPRVSPHLNRRISAIVPQADGGFILGGITTKPGLYNDGDWARNVVRIRSDGTLDESFNVQTSYANTDYDVEVYGVVPQTDGSVIIYGVFDQVKDSKGNVYSRDKVARITPGGEVDPDFALGSFGQYSQSPLDNVVMLSLATDGKVFVGGNFPSLGGTVAKHVLVRLANGSASEGLTVSPDGTTVTWLRGGTAPELWWAGFETCDDLDAAVPACSFLGRGERVAGGWRLTGLNLAPLSSGTNRYLRARGGTAGEKGSGGSLVESVRLYYFPPQQTIVTVSADPGQGKIYGDADPPLSYSFAPALSGSDSFAGALSRAPGEGAGSYPIGQGTLALDGNYALVYQGADFTVAPRGATVRAEPSGKVYGAGEPVLSVTTTGFLPGDLGAGQLGFAATRAPGEDAGSYDITPTASDSGSGLLANYLVDYQHAPFTVTPAPLTVTAEHKVRVVGAANPPLTASYDLPGVNEALLGGSPLLSTTADAASPPGDYPITVAQGSITSANYSYSFVPGILTVSAGAPQQIVFPPLRARTYGDADFDPGASATSGLPVGYASSAPAVAAVVGGKLRVLSPGVTGITASQGGDAFWTPAQDVLQSLTVNPPPWNALGFDGVASYLRVDGEYLPQFDFGASEGFCIETWLRLDGSQSDGTGLIAKTGAIGRGFELSFLGDRIAAQITGRTASCGPAEGLVGSTSLNDGQWHHVALSVDRVAGTASLYLDGRLEAQVSHAALTENPDNRAPLVIGVDHRLTNFFRGEVDEVRVWGTARDREEIRNDLAQIIDPADQPELAGYFHLDEGDAGLDNALFGMAPDRTANGADGMLADFARTGDTSNWVRSGAFLPLLETAPPNPAGPGAVESGAVVYPNYYPATDRGLCWATHPAPGLADSCLHQGTGTGSFQATVEGLAPGNLYYIRAFAVNEMGTAYGNEFSFGSGPQDQTVSLELPARRYGDPDFLPAGSASSGLALSYSSGNPAVAVVVGGALRITGAGSALITATQAGNPSYRPASASCELVVVKAPLTVRADDQTRAYLAANPPLSASYLGLVNGDTPASLSGAPLLETAAGPQSPVGAYPIRAALGTLASANYAFSFSDGTLNVVRSCQEIFFPALGEKTYGDPPFPAGAFACSGLTLVLTSSDPAVATVSGGTVTITGAGRTQIAASQGGDGNLEGARDLAQTLVVLKAGQSLAFPELSDRVLGDHPFDPGASASSGLPVVYLSSDPEVAEITGSLVRLKGAGTAVITALQPGNGNYLAALPLARPLRVVPEGEAPLVALSTLSFGSATANPVLNVAGSASDPSGIASLTVAGRELAGEAGSFSAAVPLVPGENLVEVSAADGAGNRTSQALRVAFDPAAPDLVLSEPADNGVTPEAVCQVSGSAPPGSTLTLTLNGVSRPLALGATGEFSTACYLAAGMNTVEVSAALGGRSSRVKRSVRLAPGGPSLSLVEPNQDLRTEQQEVTVKGRAGGDAVRVVLEAGGRSYQPELRGGAFEQLLSLGAPGEYRVRVRASDAAGNTSLAQRNIIRLARIPGDLDGDGSVEIGDATRLLRISLGMEPATPWALAHGDLAPLVDGVPAPDGVIDAGDVLVLLRRIVGLVDF